MKLSKTKLAFLLFLVIGTIYVAHRHHGNGGGDCEPHTRKFAEPIFGTLMNVTYTSTEDLHDTIMACLRQVDASLSMFNPQSTLARINRSETDTLDMHLQAILPMAHSISEATGGAFDITVAPLVNCWGFGFKHSQLPSDAEVDSLRAMVSYKHISCQDGRILKSHPGVVIDLSAIAKGYGTDMVAQLLNDHHVQDYMVEIGGEVVCSGNNPKGDAWHIGINRPVADSTGTVNEVQEVIHVHDRAMATSGNYRNFRVTADGRTVSHTINPTTGYPVQHSLLSCTVLASTCAMADAFATSFMVMGLDSAIRIVKQHPELQAYFIYTDSLGNYQTWSNVVADER